MKKCVVCLLILALVLSLGACGLSSKANGVYRSYVKLDSGWLDLGSTTEYKGGKAVETDIYGEKTNGTVSYDGDRMHVEFEDGTKGDYIYDKSQDAIIAYDIYEATGILFVSVREGSDPASVKVK